MSVIPSISEEGPPLPPWGGGREVLGGPGVLERCWMAGISGPVFDSYDLPLFSSPIPRRCCLACCCAPAFLDYFSSLLEPAHWTHEFFVEIEAFYSCVKDIVR